MRIEVLVLSQILEMLLLRVRRRLQEQEEEVLRH
eukprot:COSAG02_NODE_42341_length_385_cov_0.968531_1_plen_33_part_10